MSELTDLLETLDTHRGFLRHAASGLTEAQARERSTVSELSLGGLIKHVTGVEERWANFLTSGAAAFGAFDAEAFAAHAASFVMSDDETLDGLLAGYAEAAARTDRIARDLPDLAPTTRCRSRRGGRRACAGACGGGCCTSSPRPPSTPGTPTSSARPSTARRRWAESVYDHWT